MTNTTDSSMFRVGDLVIGSSSPDKSVYSATGAKLIPDGVSLYGSDADLKTQSVELMKSVSRSGGVPVNSNTGKVKKVSSKKRNMGQSSNDHARLFNPQDYQEPVKKEKPQVTIQFENEFGIIKEKVDHVVNQDLAIMLIFKDEDSLIFEPKVGESLILHLPDENTVNVYYPGVTFDSPDSSNKFMILFKLPEENQD